VQAVATQPPSEPAEYLDSLNPEQRAAVELTEGPVLVLAGAGTGKTRVLTTRIAHILNQRLAFPGQILAVTFTNKAAREMGERVYKLLGGHGMENNKGIPWLGTFHSVAAKILRRHAEMMGLSPRFTILDDDDQQRLLKALIIERNIDEKQFPPRLFSAVIQSWKDRGLVPDKVPADQLEAINGTAIQIYRAYQDRLKSLNAVDFGDLLLHNLTLFAGHPDILSEYAKRFRYILVDEYQDTNLAQYLWLRLLALGNNNLCCVGDDDQSIYSWRGAQVQNILRFEHDFPGAKVVKLERNYRSTPHILGAASKLIAHNAGRHGKTLWTEAEGGDKVRLRGLWDGTEEARWIAGEIEALQLTRSTPLSEIAILVRASFQTRAFEEQFMSIAIPYRVVGGLRFYERQEIRDIVAYLRLVYQPNDDLAFARIVNVPKRGIGKSTTDSMQTVARDLHVSQLRASEEMLSRGLIKGKTGTSLSTLLNQLKHWRTQLETMPLAEVAENLIEESGYRAMLQADKSPEAQGRLENIRELVRALGDFESLEAFIDHVGLVSDTNDTSQTEMVSIMTLHAAKGLEFHHVFLPGWEEGLFPHQRSLDEEGRGGLEEERRLAYVGITRARKRLTISYAANRRIYNQWQSSLPSRFLEELPAEHIEVLPGGAGAASRPMHRQQWSQAVQDILAGASASFHQPALAEKSLNFVEAPSSNLRVGMRVFHQKFGYGKIRSITGDHLEIDFEKAGSKKVMAGFVEAV